MKTKILFSFCLTILLNGKILPQWNSDPRLTTPICTVADDQRYPQLISDGAGGAIIAWWDDRTTVYAQRIDANGIPLWNTDGIPICTVQAGMGVGTGEPQKIISDGAGGAIIVWTDGRSGDADIFAQHVDPNGNILWDSAGVPICTIVSSQQYEVGLISDDEGGAIIVWRDDRSDITDADIYAQRIGGDGLVYWAQNGVPICVAPEYQIFSAITEDGNGGAIFTWTDYRNIATSRLDIYAQRINSSGVVQWTSNGTLICNTNDDQDYSIISSTPDGGAIIAWTDPAASSRRGVGTRA